MNIKNALSVIKDHLEKYDAGFKDKILLDNIAEPPSTGSIILTLIKIEEETSLKNGRYTKITSSLKTEFKNRPVQVNLYILFSAIEKYETALTNISKVIEFFQGKHVFTHLDGEKDGLGDEKFKLILDLQNQTMEQINHMWGFLGGKQRPSAYYKVRMIPLEAKEKIIDKGEPILTININGNTNL